MVVKNAISIIVPVYNTALYLRKCLESILSQNLHEIEIICVDDGSTDCSYEILQEYAMKDSHLQILHKENGGLVSARKAGVAIASGEYIGFVDSDDWVEPEMFERLYEAAKSNDADCVSSGYIQEGNYISFAYDSVDAGLYRDEKIHDLCDRMILDLPHRDKGVGGSLCTKLIRSGILKKVLPRIPSDVTLSEDKVTSISVLLECKSVVILHEAYYHYILHSSSMTQSANTNYLLRVNYVYQYLSTLYSHPAFTTAMRRQAELYITQLLIKGINSRLGFSIKNLLWIDPYWLKEVPAGAKVALYGGGALGEKYHQQLKTFGKHDFVALVDYDYARLHNNSVHILAPDALCNMEYEYLVITIKDQKKAQSIKQKLVEDGVEESKIRWFPQDEIFWRFAEAEGLLAKDISLDEER